MNKWFVLTGQLEASSNITDYLSSLGGKLASLYCSCKYSRSLRGWSNSWEASCSFTVITLNPIIFNSRTRMVWEPIRCSPDLRRWKEWEVRRSYLVTYHSLRASKSAPRCWSRCWSWIRICWGWRHGTGRSWGQRWRGGGGGGRTRRPACSDEWRRHRSHRLMVPTVFQTIEPLACPAVIVSLGGKWANSPGGLVCNLCPLEEKALCSPCTKGGYKSSQHFWCRFMG